MVVQKASWKICRFFAQAVSTDKARQFFAQERTTATIKATPALHFQKDVALAKGFLPSNGNPFRLIRTAETSGDLWDFGSIGDRTQKPGQTLMASNCPELGTRDVFVAMHQHPRKKVFFC